MNLMSYIVERALILIPALNVLGLIFKSIERIPDKFIPLLLLIFGISGSKSSSVAVCRFGNSGSACYGSRRLRQSGGKAVKKG